MEKGHLLSGQKSLRCWSSWHLGRPRIRDYTYTCHPPKILNTPVQRNHGGCRELPHSIGTSQGLFFFFGGGDGIPLSSHWQSPPPQGTPPPRRSRAWRICRPLTETFQSNRVSAWWCWYDGIWLMYVDVDSFHGSSIQWFQWLGGSDSEPGGVFPIYSLLNGEPRSYLEFPKHLIVMVH